MGLVDQTDSMTRMKAKVAQARLMNFRNQCDSSVVVEDAFALRPFVVKVSPKLDL